MRIAHVVTLVSPDGAYGGPLRVAINQLTALKQLGHEVRLFSTYRGYSEAPDVFSGVPLTSFPTRQAVRGVGFAGLTSGRLHRHLWKHYAEFDVVHVHLARDMVTMPAARLALMRGLPLVVQPHGMIDPSRSRLARPLDTIMTRPILKKASSILYLQDREREAITNVAGRTLSLIELRNGVPPSGEKHRESSEPLDILYLGRLATIKQPVNFVLAALRLAKELPTARFSLVGPDEGEAERVLALSKEYGLSNRIVWEGPLSPDQTLARMSRADVYVLPSRSETFSMTVLEAASVGVPSVVTHGCEISSDIESWDAGIAVDDSVDALVEGLRRLCRDPELRRKTGRRARAMAEAEFSMQAVANRLEVIYSQAVENRL